MNQAITEYLKALLQEKPFCGIAYGLVEPIVEVVPVGEGKVQRRTYPFYCNPETLTCDDPDATLKVAPDGKYPSVMWFEDQGASSIVDGHFYKMSSTLRLVVWFNTKKFAVPYCQLIERMEKSCIATICKAFPDIPTVGPANVTLAGLPEHHPSLITKWAFDESFGFHKPPYGYFAISINITYRLNPKCEPLTPLNEDACTTID